MGSSSFSIAIIASQSTTMMMDSKLKDGAPSVAVVGRGDGTSTLVCLDGLRSSEYSLRRSRSHRNTTHRLFLPTLLHRLVRNGRPRAL